MAPDMAFGPEGDRWHYSRESRTYDLSRGAAASHTVRTTFGPEDTFVTIAPALSALVVVDMQNFFLHPSLREHPTGLAAVAPTLRLVEKCRALGVQVVWLNWGLTDADLAAMPAGIQRGFARSAIASPLDPPPEAGLGVDLGDGRGRTLFAGAWNSAIYGPLADVVRPEDAHCAKNRMSGLWHPDQPLWRHLEATGARTLLFTGVNTDQCVLGTLVDGYNAGWDCVLVEDCVGTTTEYGREVSVFNIGKNYGFVIDSKTFIAG